MKEVRAVEEKLILVQEDSITDCSRDRESNKHNGRGYTHLVGRT